MHNSKLGVYRVGQECFDHKMSALVRGTQTDTHPEWDFNRSEFDLVDWKTEPEQSLWSLYAQRARQLREKYDYLILGYSGGSDSKNILDVFLHNGIRLDELATAVSYKSFGNQYQPNPNDFSFVDNVTAEWEFTAKHDFEWISRHHPEIKLSLYDWFEDFDLELPKDWLMQRNTVLVPWGYRRHGIHHLESIYKYPRVCYIMGVDKPRVLLRNGKYYIYFIDKGCYGMMPPETMVGNATIEFFYWAPESVDILRKQAHIMKKHFESSPHLHSLIQWPPTRFVVARTVYESVVREHVYPTWNPARWQCAKPVDPPLSTDRRILNFHTKLGDQVRDTMTQTAKMIDPKYNEPNGNYVGMISPLYEL